MAKIDVTIYSRPDEVCPNCKFMKGYFNDWVDNHPQHTVSAVTLSADDNIDALIAAGASAAPVFVVKRGNTETVVSGRTPDRLIDALEGLDSIWEV